jgi:hypothetical protein
MSEQHPCPHHGCSRAIPGLMWACLEHWQSLPPQIRQQIWAATRGAGPRALAQDAALDAACAFWGYERDLAACVPPGGPVASVSAIAQRSHAR